ncbi:putative C2H2 finger domain protein [Dactylonectria estremocensis]|uniref:C2H2 finger domain protein n=1 Tax=Dactylonectria estremocensis TaxID=1079267 RepID=A0A9P9J5M7_9HYPO|nr:putative C2H2 finger domain protein [Dactylonectria estremocensis]
MSSSSRIYEPFEETCLCKPCNLIFSSREKLHEHKGAMRRAGKLKHIHCKFCSENFKTQAAEITHIQQMHPKEQNLDCPACGQGPFIRLGALMQHLEGNCHSVDSSILTEMREQKLEFPNKLVALTDETVKSNYAAYMPSAGSTCGANSAWTTSNEPNISWSNKKEFPSLSKQPSRVGTQKDGNRQNELQKGNKLASKWGTKKLFPDAPPAQQPTKEQLKGASAPSARMDFEALNLDNPDHRNFNSARYYCSVTEKFLCPRPGCNKTFKKAGGLIGHLRSPAHSSTKYRCPYCLNTFSSLSAVTQHAESNGVRCHIRDSDNYNSYLDQLTSGIVDVSPTRNEDGTVKYETTDASREAFRPGSTVVRAKAADEDPWKGKEVHW